MFEVLAYIFEQFHADEIFPSPETLIRTLARAGFEEQEVRDAVNWMALLPSFDETHFVEQRHTLRIYTPEEVEQLPTQIRGFLLFLEQNEDLSPFHREVIIERLLDIPRDELDLKSAKLIILLVLWSQDAQLSVLSVDALMESISGNPTMH